MALFEKKTIIKNEIDYDILAEKIVSAQERSLKNNQESFQSTIINSVTTALEKSDKSNSKEGTATFTLIQLLAYVLLSIGFLFAAFFTITLAATLITNSIAATFWVIILLWIVDLSSLLITIMIGLSAYEIYKTKNIELINTAFTALMAFAAIIIALIQLVKGV